MDRTSIKDLIESFGIPHTEVDLILVNGKSVNFKYLINDGDDISVYPVFESLIFQMFSTSDQNRFENQSLLLMFISED